MRKALKEAVAKIEELPASDQEVAGRQLLGHLEKLQRLRHDIDEGIASLTGGYGRELDIDNLIGRTLYAPKGE